MDDDNALHTISKYSQVSDIDIIKMYKETRCRTFASIMIFRYEPAIFSAIKKWHNMRGRAMPINESDQNDIMQIGYQAMLECFLAIKEPDRVKSVGSRIMSAVRDALNKTYRHRKYETVEATPDIQFQDMQMPEPQDDINIDKIEKKLPVGMAPMFKCFYRLGYTARETAQVLYPGESRFTSTIRSRICREHQKLLEALRTIYLKTDRKKVCLKPKKVIMGVVVPQPAELALTHGRGRGVFINRA